MEEQKVNLVYVAVGSNLGNRKKNIEDSINLINSKIGQVIKTSQIIETVPIEMEESNLFLNSVILLQTHLSPDDLLNELKEIEVLLGRKSIDKGKKISRTIDLDIIFYNDISITNDELTIPHSKYHLRNFVLTPLFELNKRYIDPVKNLTIEQLIN